MTKIIEAVFENGVIRPLGAVELAEHERIRVAITPLPGAVAASQALIPVAPELVEEVAESGDFLPF